VCCDGVLLGVAVLTWHTDRLASLLGQGCKVRLRACVAVRRCRPVSVDGGLSCTLLMCCLLCRCCGIKRNLHSFMALLAGHVLQQRSAWLSVSNKLDFDVADVAQQQSLMQALVVPRRVGVVVAVLYARI